MPKRRSPESAVVEFFDVVPVEVAVTVLNICRGVVQRRQPARTRRPSAPRRPAPVAAPASLLDTERAS